MVVAIAGCGDGTSEPLTCAALDEIAQCAGRQAAALAACMPMRATTAVMSTDRTTCQWPDGTSAVFDRPLPSSSVNDTDIVAFTVFSANGSACGQLWSIDNINQTALTVDGELPALGATWNDDTFYQTLATACGSAQHAYASDLVQGGCPTIVPSFSASPISKPATFALTTTTTFGTLFTCQ